MQVRSRIATALLTGQKLPAVAPADVAVRRLAAAGAAHRHAFVRFMQVGSDGPNLQMHTRDTNQPCSLQSLELLSLPLLLLLRPSMLHLRQYLSDKQSGMEELGPAVRGDWTPCLRLLVR